VQYFDMPLGMPRSFGYVRYYGAEEMTRLLKGAGFHVRPVLGDRTGRAYSLDSPRLIAIGEA
jgi:hypothetical protein